MARSPVELLMDDIKDFQSEAEEDDYAQINFIELITTTYAAAQFRFTMEAFRNKNKYRKVSEQTLWFPLSALRRFDDEVYFNKKMAKEKGLDVR